MTGLASLIDILFTLYIFIIIGRVMLSWANISPYHSVAQWIFRLTEPLLGPIRSLIPQAGMVDWSPMIAVFALIILRQIVVMIVLSF